MNVLILRAGVAEWEVRQIDDSLESLQNIVGGYIENVPLRGFGEGSAHGYCNEEGKLDGSEPNVLATLFFRHNGWLGDDVLMGDVIVLGIGQDGDEADVPPWCIEAAQSLVERSRAIYEAV